MQKFYNYLISFDTIGPAPGISTRGNSRYFTCIGFLLTIGVNLLVLVAFRQDISDVFNEQDPRVVTQNNKNTEVINFNSTVSNSFFYEMKFLDPVTMALKTVPSEHHPKFLVLLASYNTELYVPIMIPD